jgi:hypothetical protein
MTPGSWRWRAIQERGLEQERMAAELRRGQLELGRAIQALNDRISAGFAARVPASRAASAAATDRSRSQRSVQRAVVCDASPSEDYSYYTYVTDSDKDEENMDNAPAAPSLPPGLSLPVPAAAGAAAATVHAAPVDPAAAPVDAAYSTPSSDDPWATANGLLVPSPAVVPVDCSARASRDPDENEISLPSMSPASDDEGSSSRTASPSPAPIPAGVDLGQNQALARLAGLFPKSMARPRPGG